MGEINKIVEVNQEEISLKELIQSIKDLYLELKSKWVKIFFIGLLGASLGVTYAYLKKPRYTAILTFALEDIKSGGAGLSGALGLASSLGIDLGSTAGGAFSGSNIIELMKSRKLIERALLNPVLVEGKYFSLAEYYLNFTKIRDVLDEKEQLSKIHFKIEDDRKLFTIQKDSVLGEIYKSINEEILTVSQKDKKVSILTVEVKTKNELFSKEFAESIVKEVTKFYIDSKSEKARSNVAILQKQADSVRMELNSAITGVAQASDNTFNLNSAYNIKRTPSTRRQVDVQANSAILTQLVTNLEMAKVTLLKETPLIQIIDNPILPLKKDKVGKLKSLIIGFSASIISFICFLIFKRVKKRVLV